MRAIDIHCHPPTKQYFEALKAYIPGVQDLFGKSFDAKTPAEVAQDFVEADVKSMMIAWDSQTMTDDGVITNDHVASLSADHPEAFLPGWAVVDPWKGKLAVAEAERAVKKLGLRGLKFQPQLQRFETNDPKFYPLWDACAEMNAPVLIHTGICGIGMGMPGGTGIKLKYGRPIPYIDDIAADFPDLTIIAAHPAWPWSEELIATALHKPNVHFDISGWRPKYLPPPIIREINGRLQDRVLFGSDYPSLNPGRQLDELESIGIKESVLPKLFLENARRVLEIEE